MAWRTNFSMSCPHKAPRHRGIPKMQARCSADFVRTVSVALFAFEVDRRSVYRQFEEFLHLLGRV